MQSSQDKQARLRCDRPMTQKICCGAKKGWLLQHHNTFIYTDGGHSVCGRCSHLELRGALQQTTTMHTNYPMIDDVDHCDK